jgi:hypothetical protein
MHWGLLEGAKAKVHKYIAREDTGKKTKTGSTAYRYFYSQSAWDKFKGTVSNAVNTWKTGVGVIADAGKSFADAWLVGIGKTTKFGTMNANNDAIPSKSANSTSDGKEWMSKYSMINSEMYRGATEAADRQRGTREVTYTTKSGHAVTENTSGHGKWIAKAKLANGKVRYFYDQKQYDRWKKMQEYQDNEPDYLKKVKEIDPHEENGRMPNTEEQLTLTNDLYTPLKMYSDADRRGELALDDAEAAVARSTNCIYCSMTYEMRQRGYDVQAVTKGSTHAEEFYNEVYKTDSGEAVVKSPTSKTMHVEYGGVEYSIAKYSIEDTESCVSYPSISDSAAKMAVRNAADGRPTGQGIRSVDTTKEVVSNKFPEGSRGAVNIWWDGGGGHSFLWENTSEGVKFYDAQINHVYTDKEMQDMLDQSNPFDTLTFVRTDNLTVKEDALKYCEDRTTYKNAEYNVKTGQTNDSTASNWYDTKRPETLTLEEIDEMTGKL